MTERSRILVVDDEPQITRVLRTMLNSHGYEIRAANDGEAALEVLHDWTPDLVITDLSMPQMDGLELTRRVRAKLSVPIIVLSVRGEERVKVQALDVGADDYVTKPFGMEELLARVRSHLRRKTDAVEAVPEVIEIGTFALILRRTGFCSSAGSSSYAQGVRAFALSRAASRQGCAASDVAQCYLGREQRGAGRVPARIRWPVAQENRTRSLIPAIHTD